MRGRASCGRDGLFEHACRQHPLLAESRRSGSIVRVVTDGLDVVAVRIQYICTVVVRVVLRAQARLAIVLAARGQRCYVESIDRCA